MIATGRPLLSRSSLSGRSLICFWLSLAVCFCVTLLLLALLGVTQGEQEAKKKEKKERGITEANPPQNQAPSSA